MDEGVDWTGLCCWLGFSSGKPAAFLLWAAIWDKTLSALPPKEKKKKDRVKETIILKYLLIPNSPLSTTHVLLKTDLMKQERELQSSVLFSSFQEREQKSAAEEERIQSWPYIQRAEFHTLGFRFHELLQLIYSCQIQRLQLFNLKLIFILNKNQATWVRNSSMKRMLQWTSSHLIHVVGLNKINMFFSERGDNLWDSRNTCEASVPLI